MYLALVYLARASALFKQRRLALGFAMRLALVKLFPPTITRFKLTTVFAANLKSVTCCFTFILYATFKLCLYTRHMHLILITLFVFLIFCTFFVYKYLFHAANVNNCGINRF